MHKQAALFWQSANKQFIKFNEKLNCAITVIYNEYLHFSWLLTLLIERLAPLLW